MEMAHVVLCDPSMVEISQFISNVISGADWKVDKETEKNPSHLWTLFLKNCIDNFSQIKYYICSNNCQRQKCQGKLC